MFTQVKLIFDTILRGILEILGAMFVHFRFSSGWVEHSLLVYAIVGLSIVWATIALFFRICRRKGLVAIRCGVL